jgi:hypothetical protein
MKFNPIYLSGSLFTALMMIITVTRGTHEATLLVAIIQAAISSGLFLLAFIRLMR